MSYLLLIGVIFGVIADRYILPILDLLLSMFTNNKQIQAQEAQKKINAIENDISLESLDTQYEACLIQKDIYDIKASIGKSDTNVIGFNVGDIGEICECDEDCDCDECEDVKISPSLINNKVEIKHNGRIGF